MDESLNRDLLAHVVQGIAEGRKKPEAEIRRLIDEGPFLPENAVKAGLIDEVAYEDQVVDKLHEARPGSTREIDADEYGRVSLTSLGLNRGPRIAVIYAAGEIAGGRGGYDPLNGRRDGLGHAHRIHPQGAQGFVDSRDRAARGQPGRIGVRLRCDLARADARATRARRSPDRRLDVRSGRVGRLLHCDAGPGRSSRSRRR